MPEVLHVCLALVVLQIFAQVFQWTDLAVSARILAGGAIAELMVDIWKAALLAVARRRRAINTFSRSWRWTRIKMCWIALPLAVLNDALYNRAGMAFIPGVLTRMWDTCMFTLSISGVQFVVIIALVHEAWTMVATPGRCADEGHEADMDTADVLASESNTELSELGQVFHLSLPPSLKKKD